MGMSMRLKSRSRLYDYDTDTDTDTITDLLKRLLELEGGAVGGNEVEVFVHGVDARLRRRAGHECREERHELEDDILNEEGCEPELQVEDISKRASLTTGPPACAGVRFCHVESLDAARVRIVLHKITSCRNFDF